MFLPGKKGPHTVGFLGLYVDYQPAGAYHSEEGLGMVLRGLGGFKGFQGISRDFKGF